MNIFDKFNDGVDTEELAKQIDEQSNGFDDLPAGEYEMLLTGLECKVSKSGKPMICFVFKVLAGEFTGRLLFINKVIPPDAKPFVFKQCNDLLQGLTDKEVKFMDYSQYEELVTDIADDAVEDKEILMEITYNESKTDSTKVFANYKILKAYN